MSLINLKNTESAQIDLPGVGRVSIFVHNDTIYVKKDDGTVAAVGTDVVIYSAIEPELPSPYAFWLDENDVLRLNKANSEWIVIGGVGQLVDLTDVDTTNLSNGRFLQAVEGYYGEYTFVFVDGVGGISNIQDADDVDTTDIATGKMIEVEEVGGNFVHKYVVKPTGGGSNIRLSETFYAPTYTSYLGFAPSGSLETEAVWTITKRVGSENGTILSNVQTENVKWSERNLL